MSTVTQPGREPAGRTSRAIGGGGSAIEAIAGVAAIVLAVLGLADIMPQYMAAIATIAVGVALVLECGVNAARYSRAVATTAGQPVHTHAGDVGGGITAEFLGGLAGILLGVLALLNIVPEILLASAVVVFGASLLLSSGTLMELDSLAASATGPEASAAPVPSPAGSHVLVGLGAAVLGILALVGIAPRVLTLVALLSLGASIVLSGSAIGSRMFSAIRR